MELALGNMFEWLRSRNSCLASVSRYGRWVPLGEASSDCITSVWNGGTDIELGYMFWLYSLKKCVKMIFSFLKLHER